MTLQPDFPMQAWPTGMATRPAVAELLAGGVPSAEAISAVSASVRFRWSSRRAVTFVWRGEAARVELLRFIHGGASRLPLRRLPGTDLWLLRVPVENEGRFEYKLSVAGPGARTGCSIR